jgi:hypothetical protein
MVRFCSDDLGYLAWTAAHPDGFVLNVRRIADPEYVVLHKATCDSISNDRQAPEAFTGRAYRKVCADSIQELRDAAQREGRPDRSFSKRCGFCNP